MVCVCGGGGGGGGGMASGHHSANQFQSTNRCGLSQWGGATILGGGVHTGDGSLLNGLV